MNIEQIRARLASAKENVKADPFYVGTSVYIADVEELLDQLAEYQRREKAARNELCLKCGLYHDAHNGACDGCRWKES